MGHTSLKANTQPNANVTPVTLIFSIHSVFFIYMTYFQHKEGRLKMCKRHFIYTAARGSKHILIYPACI